MNEQTIAMVGVGSVGRSLGARLVETGHRVVFGVRPGREVDDLPTEGPGEASVAPVVEACRKAALIFLAVPAEAAVKSLAGAPLAGKVIVDCTNPLSWDSGPVWAPPAEGSNLALLARTYPAGRWVKGFSSFGAALHRNPMLLGQPVDVHLAGDDEEAKRSVANLARTAGFAPVDVGPLRNAALLEAMAVLWIELAGRRGREFAFQLLPRL